MSSPNKLGEEELLQNSIDVTLNDDDLNDNWPSRKVALLGLTIEGELNIPWKSSGDIEARTVDESTTSTVKRQDKISKLMMTLFLKQHK